MPLLMLTLWIKLARNKLQSHKEEMIFQEICRFGSSTRRKVFKPQPQPHSVLASYEQGIRKIPFICVLSFPLLGFSHSSFIWLRNLFIEKCYLQKKPSYSSVWSPEESKPQGRWESKKGYVRGVRDEWGRKLEQHLPVFFSGLSQPSYDFFLTISPLLLSPLFSHFFLLFISREKVKTFVPDYLDVRMQTVLSAMWDNNGHGSLLLVQPSH